MKYSLRKYTTPKYSVFILRPCFIMVPEQLLSLVHYLLYWSDQQIPKIEISKSNLFRLLLKTTFSLSRSYQHIWDCWDLTYDALSRSQWSDHSSSVEISIWDPVLFEDWTYHLIADGHRHCCYDTSPMIITSATLDICSFSNIIKLWASRLGFRCWWTTSLPPSITG